MAVKTIIAKNITGSPVVLSRLGVTILGGQQLNLTDYFRVEELWEATDLTSAINAAQIIINDGTSDLTATQSLNYVSSQSAQRDINTELENASASPSTNRLMRWSAGGLVDGITPSAHGSRHNPGGDDPVATAAPPTGIGAANSVGTATTLARSDHNHTIRETGGPTDLVMNAVADGKFFKRSGSLIVGADPAAASSVFKQSALAEITVNTTTTAVVFADPPLLELSITAGDAGFLLIWFTASVSAATNNRTAYFRVLVDGVVQRGAAARLATGSQPQAVGISLRVPVAAGARVVKVQWRVDSALAVGQIRPVAAPDAESASLLVAEVSA